VWVFCGLDFFDVELLVIMEGSLNTMKLGYNEHDGTSKLCS
jgi:hypothetical protein